MQNIRWSIDRRTELVELVEAKAKSEALNVALFHLARALLEETLHGSNQPLTVIGRCFDMAHETIGRDEPSRSRMIHDALDNSLSGLLEMNDAKPAGSAKARSQSGVFQH